MFEIFSPDIGHLGLGCYGFFFFKSIGFLGVTYVNRRVPCTSGLGTV